MKLKLKIDGETHELEIQSDKIILENLKEFDIPWSCLNGHCSSVKWYQVKSLWKKSDLEIDFDY